MALIFDYDDSQAESSSNDSKKKLLASEKRSSVIFARAASAPIEDELQAGMHSNNNGPEAKLRSRASTEDWSTLLADLSGTNADNAVEDFFLPCGVRSFCENFVNDEASYSVSSFMSENGDDEIQCSPWKTNGDDGSESRTIEYTHPINAPMAPPMARAKKEQVIRKFGDKGAVLETKTYVSDVPMTDCFFVEDRIIVKAAEEGVSVTMSFEIQFVKQTMFKSIISRTTKGEIEKFMKRLAAFMSKSLGEAPTVDVTQVKEPEQNVGYLTPSRFEIPVMIVLIIIVVGQIWIMRELVALRADFRSEMAQVISECPASHASPIG